MKHVFKNAFQSSVLSRTGNHTTHSFKDDAAFLGQRLKENYNPKDTFFRKSKEGHSINNLYSGYELGGKGNLLMAGGLLGGGTILASDPTGYKHGYLANQSVDYQSGEQDVESLQSTRADGLTYTAQVGTSNMVTPSGDLVFAMHKTRHHGQL